MVYLHLQYMWGTMLSFKRVLVQTLSLTHAEPGSTAGLVLLQKITERFYYGGI